MDFERKLASMQPKQLREIELPEKTTPPMSRDHNKSRDLWSRTKPFASGLAGFLLGVVATYLTMSPPTPVTETETVVVTPVLDDAAIATLRRPMDLRQLASVRIVKEPSVGPPPETEFQYRTLLLKEIERQRR